jgi:hypothetical protein
MWGTRSCLIKKLAQLGRIFYTMANNMSGADFAAKWANRLSNSTAEITRGVDSVTEAPSARAVKKQAKLIANWNAAINNGKWAQKLGAVTLEDWRSAMKNKGISRIATGANEATAKMADFGTKLLNYQQANLPKIYSLPDTNQGETKARMNAWFDIMAKFKP